MNPAILAQMKRWFLEYARSFYSGDADVQAHIRLKEAHTARVCDRMGQLSDSLRLTPEQDVIACLVALFHDVGRFRQYTQYRTFNDFRSEDHACLGVRILRETGVLAELPPAWQALVQTAVRYHNGREIPPDDAETVFFARMIRDADKLDILEMITSEEEELRMLPMPEYGGMQKVSAATLEFIMTGQVARFEHIRTGADLLLFRMSWVFDMNFSWTFREVQRRQYLEKMAAKLPDTSDVRTVTEFLLRQRDRRAME